MTYTLDLVESRDRLLQLWNIDNTEYQQNSVSFPTFEQWWKRYDLGLKIVTLGSEIIAATGIWGLNRDTIRQFIGGQINEDQLQPLALDELEQRPTDFWYVSGIFSHELRHLRTPLRLLLTSGLGAWVASAHIKYPAHCYALGYSEEGKRMLERFGFEIIKTADEMPDGCPLYWRQFKSAQEIREPLKR